MTCGNLRNQAVAKFRGPYLNSKQIFIIILIFHPRLTPTINPQPIYCFLDRPRIVSANYCDAVTSCMVTLWHC